MVAAAVYLENGSTLQDICPAMAACLTFDADYNQTIVEYNPLWLELRQKQEPVQGGMQLTV